MVATVTFTPVARACDTDMSAAKNNPSDFLKTVIGRPVVVKLNSGVDYRGMQRRLGCFPNLDEHASARMAYAAWSPLVAGVLACLDGYMNIAMEQTEEYVNGQLKAKYGDTFIRGNNGECACTMPTALVASLRCHTAHCSQSFT